MPVVGRRFTRTVIWAAAIPRRHPGTVPLCERGGTQARRSPANERFNYDATGRVAKCRLGALTEEAVASNDAADESLSEAEQDEETRAVTGALEGKIGTYALACCGGGSQIRTHRERTRLAG